MLMLDDVESRLGGDESEGRVTSSGLPFSLGKRQWQPGLACDGRGGENCLCSTHSG